MTLDSAPVAFEQPLTERVRTFLRLEFLFAKHQHDRADTSNFGLRSTLHSLLDILVVLSRSDLKNDILKELNDQHAHLTKLAARPGVDQDRLRAILVELGQTVALFQQVGTQFANVLLRENDFMVSVLNRSTIPGGTCDFDLPHYHCWLSQPDARARIDLDRWFANLRPFEQAIGLYLRLLRNSVAAQSVVARGGMHIHTPQAPCQLVRVLVSAETGVYPEISAGKHRFTVRFMTARDVNLRSQQATSDIAFQMQCCLL